MNWAGPEPVQLHLILSFQTLSSSTSTSQVSLRLSFEYVTLIPVAVWIPLIPFSSSCGSVCPVPAPLIYPPPFVFYANSTQTIPGLSPHLLNPDYLSPGLLPQLSSAQLSWAPFPTLLTPAQTPLPFTLTINKLFASIHSLNMYGKNPDLAQNIRVAGINSVMRMLSFNLLLTGDTVMNGYNKEHPLKAHRGKFHHLKKTT